MNAPGKGMLKVVSILFIIFGAIATLMSLLAVLGAAAVMSIAGGLGGLLMVAMILMLVVSVVELIIGIIGVKKCGDPSQANFFIATGIVLCILALVSVILSVTSGGEIFTGVIGFVLPILYIVGGNSNKKAAVDTSVAS